MDIDDAERPGSRERRSARKNDQAVGSAASEPRRGPKSCSSHYKGVTKHRRTGRWEAHIWGRAINKGPGKQIYLGGFVTPEEAAEAHDLAALQLQGPNAKTNFHISRYADWLATLQATPSEDNLPLQLRRAGMFKRCTDRAKQHPVPQHNAFRNGEPITPLHAEAKARLSIASDSTQTVDASQSQLYFEQEDSVNSQALVGLPATLRRPLPVRYNMPAGADHRHGSADGLQNSISATLQSHQQGSNGGHHNLPSQSEALYLSSQIVPQLVPLGWKSFEALAQAQAQATVAHGRPAGEPKSLPMASSPTLTAGTQEPSIPSQHEGATATWLTTSAGGGFVYGHKNFLGFLTPEQVRVLEASGVKFPEHLQMPKALAEPLLAAKAAVSEPQATASPPAASPAQVSAPMAAPLPTPKPTPMPAPLSPPAPSPSPLPTSPPTIASEPAPAPPAAHAWQPAPQADQQATPPSVAPAPSEPPLMPTAPFFEQSQAVCNFPMHSDSDMAAKIQAVQNRLAPMRRLTNNEDQQIAEALLGLRTAK